MAGGVQRTTLPAITVHEVTPGHFAHGRASCAAAGATCGAACSRRRSSEGWAHYAEELSSRRGSAPTTPASPSGSTSRRSSRVTRLAVAIGVHTGTMSVDDATRRFEADAFLPARPPAARPDGLPGPHLRALHVGQARDRGPPGRGDRPVGTTSRHRRFHDALLALGAPPLGLMGDALVA